MHLRPALFVAVIGLTLAGCGTFKPFGQAAKTDTQGTDAMASAESDTPTDEVKADLPSDDARPGLLGADPNDELNLGKKYFRAADFGLAENHFRHAVELHPRDAEAWVGLAASCDRLRRFDLADRAYVQAIKIVGPVPEILNNQGYSYMLRGDYARARKTLLAAQRKDPNNRYVLSNLRLLDESQRTGKAIE
jgi:Flp pilus assembly protein TadD